MLELGVHFYLRISLVVVQHSHKMKGGLRTRMKVHQRVEEHHTKLGVQLLVAQ